nr:hypothetical protein [Pyrinomonadaceae bacterium]
AQNYTSPYFNIAIANATPPGIVVRRRVVPPTREQQLAYQRAVQAQRERGRLMIKSGRVETTFQPTGGTIAPGVWAEVYAQDGNMKQELERTYNEYVERYETNARKLRMSTNDVAVALGNLISTARVICNDAEPLNEEQFASLVTQLRARLVKNELFAGRDNAEKQRVHEEIAMGWGDIGRYYFEARQAGDLKLLAGVRQSARRIVGYHLNEMSLDNIQVTQSEARLPVR